MCVYLLVDNLQSVLFEMCAQPLCSSGWRVDQERTGNTLSINDKDLFQVLLLWDDFTLSQVQFLCVGYDLAPSCLTAVRLIDQCHSNSRQKECPPPCFHPLLLCFMVSCVFLKPSEPCWFIPSHIFLVYSSTSHQSILLLQLCWKFQYKHNKQTQTCQEHKHTVKEPEVTLN